MVVSRLRNVGGSVMFAIPKSILEGLGLAANSEVGLTVADGRLIVEPHPKPAYRLADLVAQCGANAPLTDEDRQWLDDAPRGREAI
jgi:antitoxin ChpS